MVIIKSKLILFAAVISIIAICFSACSKNISFDNIKVGDTVSYGTYEQDNNKSNGTESIEWLVLAKENGRILLISKYALDCKTFFLEETETSWEDSYLRNWLNTEFIQNAFNDTEISSIAETEIQSDEDNKETTKDKIFVLNNDEAEKYFISDISRRCSPTAYAKQCGVLCPEDLQDVKFDEDIKNTCCYWLRSPGFHDNMISIVDYEGKVYIRGEFTDEEIAVRPAFWLNNTDNIH